MENSFEFESFRITVGYIFSGTAHLFQIDFSKDGAGIRMDFYEHKPHLDDSPGEPDTIIASTVDSAIEDSMLLLSSFQPDPSLKGFGPFFQSESSEDICLLMTLDEVKEKIQTLLSC